MPATNRWLALLLLGQLGNVPADELVQLMGGAGLPALRLGRSDRRQRDVAAVRRELALRTLAAVDAWIIAGVAKGRATA